MYMAIVVYAPALALEQVTMMTMMMSDDDDDNDSDDSRAGHRLPARHRRRRHLRRLHLLLCHRRDQGSHVDGHVPSRLHVRLLPRDHHQGQLRCWGRFDCLRHQLSIRTS